MKKKDLEYKIADETDIDELYALQINAFESEAEMIGSRNVPALMESYDENRKDFKNWTVLIKRNTAGRIVGAVRFKKVIDYIEIGRLMVARDCRNKGIATSLLSAVEDYTHETIFELYTCTKSDINISLYQKLGYKGYKIVEENGLDFIYMRKEL